MSNFTHCGSCRGKLEHTSLFCPECGLCTCSWNCHTEHAATHAHGPSSAGCHDTSSFATSGAQPQTSER